MYPVNTCNRLCIGRNTTWAQIFDLYPFIKVTGDRVGVGRKVKCVMMVLVKSPHQLVYVIARIQDFFYLVPFRCVKYKSQGGLFVFYATERNEPKNFVLTNFLALVWVRKYNQRQNMTGLTFDLEVKVICQGQNHLWWVGRRI